ncbi:MAG: GntR family transcriptional regulator [Clostridiaceae bacterium]|nr:GntR family transcriptional regulator [Clostridiaceae bacterium]
MPGTVRHGSLRTEVYQQLRERILQGYYTHGTTLTELRVSHELGVSRTPIREALCQLELDGLVMTTPNKSVVVQGFSDQDILDLYEVRSRMETLAAARAAVQMTEEQRRDLQAAYDEEVRQTKSQDGEIINLQNLDSTFHDLIFRGSGSKILRNILMPINLYTQQARLVSLSTSGRSQKVLQEHELILQAILQRDSEKAHEQMRIHIAMAAASYQAISRIRRST